MSSLSFTSHTSSILNIHTRTSNNLPAEFEIRFHFAFVLVNFKSGRDVL